MFSVVVRFTGLLQFGPIPDFDTYLTHVRAVRRQEYRKGREQGLSIEASTDVELLSRLHAITFERQGLTRSSHEEELVMRICGAALQHGFGELLVCRDKHGHPVSATLFLRDDRYRLLTTLERVIRNTARRARVTVLLMENIKRAYDRGLTRR